MVHDFPWQISQTLPFNQIFTELVSHLDTCDIPNILTDTYDTEMDWMQPLPDREVEERHHRQKEQHERRHGAMGVAYAENNI